MPRCAWIRRTSERSSQNCQPQRRRGMPFASAKNQETGRNRTASSGATIGERNMFVKAGKLAIIAAAVAGFALASSAQAQDIEYPVDTVTLVTHSSPGGGTDVYLREMIKFL